MVEAAAGPNMQLQTCDNVTIDIPMTLVEFSKTLKNVLEDGEEGEVAMLPNINEETMREVIRFLEYLQDNPEPTITKPIMVGNIHDVTETWYADFIDKENHNKVFDLIIAANYLDIKNLLDLGCAKIATLIKVREAPEIRELFGIENDFTPEEEAKIIEENNWAKNNF
jgi:S-phase kinase-associated protein 1